MNDKEHSGAPAGEENVSRETSLNETDGASSVSRETFLDEGSGAANVSRETSGAAQAQGRNKRSSFYVYLAVLFGAAFLMLLLAYFVQRRNNETAMSELRSTMNLSREELMEQIEALEEEKQGLAGQIAELEEQLKQEQEASQEFQTLYDGARASASHLEYSLHRRGEAMELFWRLDLAYAQRDYTLCRELVELMEGGALKDFLPDGGERETYEGGGWMSDWPSPAERYQEICDKLAKR